MDFLKLGMMLFFVINTVIAGPRYIAIPIEGIDIIEVNPISSAATSAASRHPRRAAETSYIPVTIPDTRRPDDTQVPAQQRPERSTAHIFDFVDFGVHTGANGAYSWYADYPTH